MKTQLFFQHIFFGLSAFIGILIPFCPAKAQCADQATIYALSTSIPYCSSAPCTSQAITITFPLGCTDITGFTFEAIGGITVNLASAATDGNGNYSVEVEPLANNICKGRLVMRYYTEADNPCNIPGQYPTQNMRFLDVYKQIPTSALSAIYAIKPNTITPLGSPFRIIAETPPCIAHDDRFNLTIYPVFESCLHDGIGLDEIFWEAPEGFTEVLKTEEGSSVTFRAPNANMPLTNDFSVFVGKYNAGLLGNSPSANATVTLSRGIGRPAILAYSPNGVFNYLAQGNTDVVAEACIPINRGGADLGSQGDRFTLQCVPDEQTAASYTWSVPPQFFLVNGSTINNRVITVEARNRTGSEQGASGVFTCRVQATESACGEDYAFMIIGRGLVAEENGQPYNYITVSPAPTQGPNGQNCFSPDQEYTFTLERAPLNTILQWNHTYPTPPQSPDQSYWLITGQPTQSSIKLKPVVVGGDLIIPLSVQSAAPCSDQVIHYKVGTEDPQIAGTSLEFRFATSDPINAVALEGRIPPSGTWTADWPELIGGTGCQADDYFFTWSFSGGDLFPSISSGNGLNTVPVFNGTYSGTLRVVVESKAGTPACAASRCFFVDHSEVFTNHHFRMAVAGNQSQNPMAAPLSESASVDEKAMQLIPNPASGQVSVRLSGLEAGGQLQLISNLQVVVRRQSGYTSGSHISLKGIPAGIYTMEYLSPDGERVSKRLSVE